MTEQGIIEVVDDDEAMRDSLVALLEGAQYRVRAHASAEELLAVTDLADSGCVVSDVRLPGLDGLGLLRRLRADGEAIPLVMITGHGDVPLAVAAMKAGAVDFLEKPFEAEVLFEAVAAALTARRSGGGELIDVEAARESLNALTQRELEVLQRLVAGDSNKIAAEKLGVSHRTVEFHRAHILDKTGARGLPDLVRLWLAARTGS